MVIFVVFVVFRAEGQLQDVADASEMHLRSDFLLFLLGQELLLRFVLSAQRGVKLSFGPFWHAFGPILGMDFLRNGFFAKLFAC